MDWKNASKHPLPANNQEVLISVDNVKYVAVYDAALGGFITKEEKEKIFLIKSADIYWAEIKKP
jgi:hypothetical protein